MKWLVRYGEKRDDKFSNLEYAKNYYMPDDDEIPTKENYLGNNLEDGIKEFNRFKKEISEADSLEELAEALNRYDESSSWRVEKEIYQIASLTREIKYKDRADISEGCTLDLDGGFFEFDEICRFDDYLDARSVIKDLRAEWHFLCKYGMYYFEVTEYWLRTCTEDEFGDLEDSGNYDCSCMKIVVSDEDGNPVVTYDNYLDAEEHKKIISDGNIYIDSGSNDEILKSIKNNYKNIKKKEPKNFSILTSYGEYTVLNRHTEFQPFVAAYKYNKVSKDWAFGEYFEDLFDACDYAKTRGDKEYVSYGRLVDVASRSIEGLFLDEPNEAASFLFENLEIDEREAKLFNVSEQYNAYKNQDKESNQKSLGISVKDYI